MTRLSTLRSAQRLCALLLDNSPLEEIEKEAARTMDGIQQMRPKSDILPFPIKPEMCLSETWEADEQGYTTQTEVEP